MGLYADLQAKITADREAGRDLPPVIEEIALMISNFLDPQNEPKPAPPVSNDHVAEGATQFTPQEIAASAEVATHDVLYTGPAPAPEPSSQEQSPSNI